MHAGKSTVDYEVAVALFNRLFNRNTPQSLISSEGKAWKA